MATKPVVVLVPGAWHFPSCFDLFVEHLEAEGYPTKTVAHASVYKGEPPKISGLQDDVQKIREVVVPLVQEGKEVIVFAHSYGGTPSTEALSGLGKVNHANPSDISKRGGVVHIVYCTAFVHEEGVTQLEMNLSNTDGWAGHWLTFGTETSWIHKEHAIDALYADVPLELAQKMVDHLGMIVLSVSTTPLKHCAWREIPCTYIVCEEDKAIFPVFQERMAKIANIDDIVRLSGSSHSPFLSRPKELVRIIDRIVKAKSSKI